GAAGRWTTYWRKCNTTEQSCCYGRWGHLVSPSSAPPRPQRRRATAFDGGRPGGIAMAMEHKAYAFDWSRFEFDLHPLLAEALTTNGTTELQAFIDQHLAELTDPYEGESLSADWRETLGNRDVHEYGDYALTRFYDPADCWGIGYEWARLSD